MNRMTRGRSWTLGGAALVLVVGLVALAGWAVRNHIRRAVEEVQAQDAVLVIAMEVANLRAENPGTTSQEIDRAILFLGKSSVIHIGVDAGGKPTDVHGTPFRIEEKAYGTDRGVTVTSAGRDRAFDTPDDVRMEHRSSMLGK